MRFKQEATPWARGLLLAALMMAPGGAVPAAATDRNALSGEMKVLEAVINEALGQTFALPFGLLEKAEGTYLPEFGVVFSLEVNLSPARVPSMFNPRPPSKEELERGRKIDKERLEAIRQTVPRLLADHAAGLHEITPDQYVAVAVHLFTLPQGDEKLPSQLVWEVKKSDLNQYWDRKISYAELEKSIKLSEL